MDLLNGRLYIGGEKGEVIPIGSDTSLLGSGVLFWVRVALGAFTAWILLQIFNHIGDAFLFRRASNILGDSQPVGAFSDVIPVAQIALVKATEALAAIGTVVVIAMRAIVSSSLRYLLVLIAGAPAKKGFQLLDLFRRKPAAPTANPQDLAALIRQLQTTNAPVQPLQSVQPPVQPVVQPVQTVQAATQPISQPVQQPVQQPVPSVIQAPAPSPAPPAA